MILSSRERSFSNEENALHVGNLTFGGSEQLVMTKVVYSTDNWDDVREALARIDSVREVEWSYREFQGVSPLGESFESLSTDEILEKVEGYRVRNVEITEDRNREEMIIRYESSETIIEIVPDDPKISQFSEYLV